jgi:AAHS family 4-hydroxybenzoate transporter-like MFS transporter
MVDAANSILGVVPLNLGAIVGCLAVCRLADKGRPTIVIGVAFLLGAVAIAAVGQANGSNSALLSTCFLAGALSIGAQMCAVALCAAYSETSVRATGVGWAVGIGRVGGIAGPVLGGLLIAAGVSTQNMFLVTGLGSLGASVTVLMLTRHIRSAHSGS